MNKNLTVIQEYPLLPQKLPTSSLYSVNFDSTTDPAQLFTLRKKSMSLSVHILNPPSPSLKEHTRNYDHGVAHYVNILPDTDLYCHASEKEIACKLTVKKPPTNAFSFLVKMQRLYLKHLKHEHKVICSDAQTDTPIFEINAPLIVDNNGETCPTVNYILQNSNDGTCITLTPNRGWMKAQKRAFPLTVYIQISYTCPSFSQAFGFDDVPAPELEFPVGLRHHFVPFEHPFADYRMCVGANWRLNFMQSITPTKNKRGETVAYIYTDGEGNCYTLQSAASHADHACISSEIIGNLKVRYSHCCDIACGYDDDLHTYHSDFHSHIKYDPEHRILKRDTLHHYFDEHGRLTRIVNDRRVSLHIELKNGRIYCLSTHKQQLYFAYKGKNLSAVILPNHSRICYGYDGNKLTDVIFPNGKKIQLLTSD